MVAITEGVPTWFWRLGAIGIVLFLGVLAILYMTRMPDQSYSGSFDPLSQKELVIRDQLNVHVSVLAGRIGQRNLQHYQGLQAAAEYIKESFEQMGYPVREQAFEAGGKTVKNLEVELPGKSSPEEIVLFGAHYDSVLGSPGANDNASGVGALLALARLIRQEQFVRTVRFVAFVNEEPPHYRTGDMGSRVYARESARKGERIIAMLSLETIGYYSDAVESQAYPFPFGFFYPNTADFVTFVGNLTSRDLVRGSVAAFRKNTRFPCEGVAAPALVPGVGWSDHWSFWKEGYSAMMVTDTAFYRYEQYHTGRDTPEIIDYDRLARVVTGLAHVLRHLAL